MATRKYQPKNRKLTGEQARQARARACAGEHVPALAEEYGLAIASMYDVIAGRSHASRVTVTLDDDVYERLAKAADAADVSIEAHAARLLSRAK